MITSIPKYDHFKTINMMTSHVKLFMTCSIVIVDDLLHCIYTLNVKFDLVLFLISLSYHCDF